jgi:hypothetical protein
MTVNGITTSGHASTTILAATKLRRIVEDPNAFLMCPGVYDGYSARIALQVGFDGIYMVRLLIEYSGLQHTTQQSSAASPSPNTQLPPYPSLDPPFLRYSPDASQHQADALVFSI